jgi:SAM-dependent methyltransferase
VIPGRSVESWVCPLCRGPLRPAARAIACDRCCRRYPAPDGVVDFVVERFLSPSARRVRDEWEAMSDSYRAVVACIPPARFVQIDRPLIALARGDVLEVGCGDGRLLVRLARAPLRSLLGVDVAPGMVRLASARGCTVAVASAERLPLPDRSLDVVLSGYYALRYADLDRSLSEAARVLRPGGRLGFTLLGRRIAELRGRLNALPLLCQDRSRWLAAETLLGRAAIVLPNDLSEAAPLRTRLADCGLRLERLLGTPYLPLLGDQLLRWGVVLPYLRGDAAVPWSYDLIVAAAKPGLD